MITTCKNCSHQFKGNFCNFCGQTAETHEINIKFLWHDIQHGLLHLDKGILFTIKELFTRPGYTIREFIIGKRVKHFKPISFVIVLAGLYGFLMHYFNIASFMQVQISSENDTRKVIDIEKVINWVSSHYAFSTLFLLPFVSLTTYWAFKKDGYNYIQHLILNSFLSGLHIVLRILCFPFIFLFRKENALSVLTIPDVIGVVFTVWTLFQLFDKIPLRSRIWKIVLSYIYLGLLCITFVILIAAIVTFILARHKH